MDSSDACQHAFLADAKKLAGFEHSRVKGIIGITLLKELGDPHFHLWVREGNCIVGVESFDKVEITQGHLVVQTKGFQRIKWFERNFAGRR